MARHPGRRCRARPSPASRARRSAASADGAAGDPDRDRGAEPRESLGHGADGGNAPDLAVQRGDNRSDRESRDRRGAGSSSRSSGEERQRHQPGEGERADDDPPALVARRAVGRPAGRRRASRRRIRRGRCRRAHGCPLPPRRRGRRSRPRRSRGRARGRAARSCARRPRRGRRAGSCAGPRPGRRRGPAGSGRRRTSRPRRVTAAPTTAADGVDHCQDGDEQRPTDEDQLLQRGVERVRRLGAVAAGHRGPDRAKHRRDRGHRQAGGGRRDGDGGDRGTDLTENGDEAEQPRVEHHPPPQHGPGAPPIDLPAPVGRADRDGDRVGGRDETGLAVTRAGPSDEQHERQSAAIPNGSRATMLQASSEAAYRVGEELAVARDAPRLRRVVATLRRAARRRGRGPRRIEDLLAAMVSQSRR